MKHAATASVDPNSGELLKQDKLNVENAMQELLKSMEKATPGIQEIEKANKMLTDSRSLEKAPEGEYTLQSLFASTKNIGNIVVKTIRAARVQPSELGPNCVESARLITDIINHTRNITPGNKFLIKILFFILFFS